ncbi:MAG: hypothetical protein MJ082_05930 [Clostridia bacterium]|nr:hypothetical protein [Clostridia bacterium]
MDAANNALEKMKTDLTDLEASFPEEIKTELTAKASEIEKAMNDAKAAALAEFEKEYTETITLANEKIAAHKAALKEAAK